MTTNLSEREVLGFVAALLGREGAATEPLDAQRLDAVVPPGVAREIEAPEAVRLRFFGEPEPGETPFPLEGHAMQWAVDRARSRGRLAGARLSNPPRVTQGLIDETRRLVRPLNAALEHVEVLPGTVTVALLEFAYEARSEERTDGRVFVAVPDGVGAPSVRLAEALLGALDHAAPESPAMDVARIEAGARAALPLARAETEKRLEAFLAGRRRRLTAEAVRLAEYFDRLAREAKRRPGRGRSKPEVQAEKQAAVLRQRAERLEDLAERHAVEVEVRLAGALVVRYEAVRCRIHLRRKRRELSFVALVDPLLGEALGAPCAACGQPTLAFSACDRTGRLVCGGCE